MITSRDIRDKKFEKAAFGYKQEEIDEFLDLLEAEFVEIENERDDANSKIQILADKVREYMRDEDALKDALLDAQKQGHKIVAEANDRADEIVAEAQKKADALMEEATSQHEKLMEENRKEIEKEKQKLADTRKEVSDFKKRLFDMYKEHLAKISIMPEIDDDFSSSDFKLRVPEREKDRERRNKEKQLETRRKSVSLAEKYENQYKDDDKKKSDDK